MTWIFVIAAVLFAIALAMAFGATLRGQRRVKDAQRVQARELYDVGEFHLNQAEREHNAALEQISSGEERRIRAERKLATASAEIEDAARLDPDG
jgi:uncharacterized protein HemX